MESLVCHHSLAEPYITFMSHTYTGCRMYVNIIFFSLSVSINCTFSTVLINFRNMIVITLLFFKGTFDIQTALVNSNSPGAVNVICTFATNSQALGCLVVLHSWNTTQTEIFAYAARDNRHAPTANISIHGVPRGNYTVLVFDGEYNGLPSERAAITPQNITVTDGGLDSEKGKILANFQNGIAL